MDIVNKIYGENGLYNKLKTIKSADLKIKDSYNSVIPLNIYLTWSTKELPIKMQENIDRMKKVNPEFNIQLYDDYDCKEFIKNNFPEDILIAFDTLKPGAYKADLWRLCILYINGGIYCDIKLNCINNFKFIALIEREHFVLDISGQWKEENFGLFNALIVAKPKNKLLLRCINKISENVKNKNYDYNFLYPTGPGLLGEEYIKMLKENESTMDTELNKLDLCLDVYGHKNGEEKIIFNNVAILNYYTEYRDEQDLFSKTLPYYYLYDLKQIYNEVIEPSDNNIVGKVYDENGIYNKFKNIKSTKLKIKDSHNSFIQLTEPSNHNFENKIYGENGIYDKLKTIKSTNFQIKDYYNSVIPLNIYLTWGTKELPIKMQENVDRMKKVNPEFNIQLFDDCDCREFIKNNFSENILTAFDTLKPGAYKADLWRLCILYINGGIYIDIKLNCINNFKFIALTEKEHFVLDRPGHWKEGEIGLHNALLVAKPKNNLLLRCINKISKNVKNKNYDYLDLYPTGPGLLGEEYIKMLRENESIIQVELDKLDLCFEENEQIIFNNVPILNFYKEYKTEKKLFGKTTKFDEIYNLKQIYDGKNDSIIEADIESTNNKEYKIYNLKQNYNIFNKYNLILFFTIIIVFFCIFLKL